MIKSIRNWTLGVLFFGLCMIGFAGPLIWPELYTHHYSIPLVQHHVELCGMEPINVIQFCEPFEVIGIA